jgi:hypothetical protein
LDAIPSYARIFSLVERPIAQSSFQWGGPAFWIVYEVDELERTVNILKVWNSKQDPDDFEF